MAARGRVKFPDLIVPGADEIITIEDPGDMGASSRVSQRLPSDIAMVRYRLRDRSLLRRKHEGPIATHSRLNTGDLHLTRIADRFGTAMEIGGDGLPRYWFGLANAGAIELRQGRHAVVASGTMGLAVQGLPGTRALSTDNNVRTNLWVEADALEHVLASMLDDAPKDGLAFVPAVDWSTGLAASLVGLMDHLASDARRQDGLVRNAVAFASFQELLLRTILLGVPHNHATRLAVRGSDAVPRVVRRAEDFMRAHADRPLRMAEVASAAGCSLRTLEASFARARGGAPLAALRAIRLDRIRDALRGPGGQPVAALARRYGFTNAGRFATAYRERFGERPSDTLAGTRR